jgi:hypothetical protein
VKRQQIWKEVPSSSSASEEGFCDYEGKENDPQRKVSIIIRVKKMALRERVP